MGALMGSKGCLGVESESRMYVGKAMTFRLSPESQYLKTYAE